ncbi:hypothetical protein B4098_0278 [Heyndrickxia coagulans]|uniref:Uncharacterized protein n=1 Tax=Heyndrickxia coagulans TaxID=1398 RepID=A0A150JUY4_HEYCO|nr:hypothetical protein B4098_0278 [Heyndrickxia coagulans]
MPWWQSSRKADCLENVYKHILLDTHRYGQALLLAQGPVRMFRGIGCRLKYPSN